MQRHRNYECFCIEINCHGKYGPATDTFLHEDEDDISGLTGLSRSEIYFYNVPAGQHLFSYSKPTHVFEATVSHRSGVCGESPSAVKGRSRLSHPHAGWGPKNVRLIEGEVWPMAQLVTLGWLISSDQ